MDNNDKITTKNKKKIQAYLEKYKTEKEFAVTDRKISYWFNVINSAMFENKLPRPSFEIKKMNDDWGMYQYDTLKEEATIFIDSGINSRDLFISTLSHELVHAWQQINEHKLSHSASFQKWKRKFKKKLNITL